MREISSIINLSYNLYIFDLYGVIYAKDALLKNVISVFSALKDSGKKILLLSNAPRPSSIEIEKLRNLGLGREKYDGIYTSGDSCSHFISQHMSNKKFYYFGMEHNRVLLNELMEANEALTLCDADFVLFSGPKLWGDNPEKYHDFFNNMLQQHIPLYCANSDRIAHVNGKLEECAGSFADYFANIGGVVYWFGKPLRSMYEEALRKFQFSTIPKSEILMIGDSFETDILGAKNFKINSLLCHKSGIHADSDLTELVNFYNLIPTYITDEIK
jgi:HAD superfamily hydrolase (TIGR01459 family)